MKTISNLIRARKLLFLRDAALFTLTSFGGPQAHMGIMLREFVKKRRYVTEEELIELNALAQVLPGPSSTQTLIGVSYKVGGLWLALLTFLIWIVPAAAIMCFIAISFSRWYTKQAFDQVLLYVQPIAVGIVAYAAYSMARAVLKSRTTVWLAVIAIVVTLILKNAYVFPILILLGGIVSSALETPSYENELKFNLFSKVNRNKVLYFAGILLVFAVLGAVINQTSPFSLPIRLFENFYRNGIIIFGGGQVLVPLMYTEFVEMKHYLSSSEFLSGYAFQQAIPGPTFSFTSFVGAMALKNNGYGVSGQILGSVVAMLGINLPGLILVLFIVPFWNDLKNISRIKHSLTGISAVSVGFYVAAFVFLFNALQFNLMNMGLVVATFLLLNFTRIRVPLLILAGILVGLFLH
ncbi:chromate efflux transporter [Pedobacter sp. BS3]|uniref:chromate efflux transporter n=1 Tax=Pedobacter sp. BS3 TaxID=2567937 RepID=UPI0011EC2683|nr:chromate efflux transporter [Pedobacter sp. BS3]TZF84691.1 chromate efflux transporter [Pedobacter sp. BS3]